MKNTPLVTVAVIFRNEEKNLSALLSSLSDSFKDISQDFFEILFVDNQSTDNSLAIIKQKLETNLVSYSILKRTKNHMADARQQALVESTTPWVLFLDADTRVPKNWARNVVRVATEAEKETLAIGGGEISVGELQWHEFAKSLASYFPMGKKPGKSVSVTHVPTNNYLVRKNAALGVGGFNSFFHRVGEDLDINVRIRKMGVIKYNPSFMVEHMLPESLTSWYQKMALYGRAQTYVALENRGGVSKEKFIPLLLLGLFLVLLNVYPLTTILIFVVASLIPRTQFFMLSFLFYGLGEFVGFFRFFHLKMNSKRTQPIANKIS